MRKAAIVIALLLSGTATAQTGKPADVDTDVAVQAEVDVAASKKGIAADSPTLKTPTSDVVQPSNANPERDARGIAVISDPALVPAGYNGIEAVAMGGPELDPATGEAVEPDAYPACTAKITDNCLQTYERGLD